MKILILSFHYFPDLCAGSFRSTAFVEQLKEKAGDGTQIDVLTTLPNRYATYKVEAPIDEQKAGVSIHRIALPRHESGMLDQAFAFVYFVREVNRYIKNKQYDLVYATSSRLMAAVLGAWVSRRKKAILYLDIRDIFVETLGDIFPPWISIVAVPWFSLLEKWSFSRAQCINLVSKGFAPYFNKRYPKQKLTWFTNGIDPEFMNITGDATSILTKKMTILYAGNVGEGQGLHRVIPQLALRLEGHAQFKIIGDGGRLTQLKSAVEAAQCQNVDIVAPLGREALIREYMAADILFIHLNDHASFLRVLPSKIFEYAATGKPIWAGVSGYAGEFIRAEVSNSAIFDPCDVDQALDVLPRLQRETSMRHHFIQKYQRSHIMEQMALELLSLLR